MRPILWCAVSLLTACGFGEPPDSEATGDEPRGFEPPVVMNPESPVMYPPRLYRERIDGTVVLLLYIDEDGHIVADSTRIAESSGQPALDSAAIAGVPAMRFAPARQDGEPVATLFLQPVHFQHPANVTVGDES